MRITLVILLVAMLAPFAHAGNTAYDDPLDATGWNTQKKLARDADGDLYATYIVPDGAGTAVVVARAESGSLVEVARPRAAAGNPSRPTIAVDAGGGSLWVAWTERAEDDREVFAARVVDGQVVGAQQLSGGLGYAGFPSLAADDAGHVHVAWYGFDGEFYQTFYREWDGDAWLPARQLSSGNLDANNPSVVVDREGGVHVAWYKSDGHRYRIWYAHRPEGKDWSLPVGISQGEGEAFNGALAIDTQGRVHAAWDELHDDGYRVMHAMRPAPGMPWRAPQVVAQGADAGEYPAIAAFGGVVITWATADGRILGVYHDGATPGKVQPFFGGAQGAHPSLRGPQPAPLSEGVGGMDAMWTEYVDGAPVVRVAEYGGCPLPAPIERCPATPSASGAPRDVPAAPALLGIALAAWSMARRR